VEVVVEVLIILMQVLEEAEEVRTES